MNRLASITITPEYFHSKTLATMPMEDAVWLVAYAKKLEEALKLLQEEHRDRWYRKIMNDVLKRGKVNDAKAE